MHRYRARISLERAVTHHDVCKEIAGLPCLVSVNFAPCPANLAAVLTMAFLP